MKLMNKWETPLRGREPYELGAPGIGLQATKWLKDKEMAAVAADTLAVEVIPFKEADMVLNTSPKQRWMITRYMGT